MAGSKEEQAHIAEIYTAVNDEFIKMGHPEFVRKGIKETVKSVESAPKKTTCIIAGQLKQFLKIKDSDKTL